MKNEKKKFWNIKSIWGYIKRNIITIIAIVLLLSCIIIIFYVRKYLIIEPGPAVINSSEYIKFNYDLSSAFNNWVSPFIAIVAAFLTFFVFYTQVKANKFVQDQFNIQYIKDEIRSLEEYANGMKKIEEDILAELNIFTSITVNQSKITFPWKLKPLPFRKLIYLHESFKQNFQNIEEIQSDKDKIRLKNKLKSIYDSFYKDYLLAVRTETENLKVIGYTKEQIESKVKNEPVLQETLRIIENLEELLNY